MTHKTLTMPDSPQETTAKLNIQNAPKSVHCSTTIGTREARFEQMPVS